MRIAFCAAECTPLIKVGGLADVVGALPRALAQLGHDVRIFLPAYTALDTQRFRSQPTSWAARAVFDGQPTLVHVRETVLPNSSIPIYLVEWPDEFTGDVYPLGQDTTTLRSVIRRFARFSAAVAALLTDARWTPDLVHCHDWHTGLIPALLHAQHHPAKTIFTIHNIDIQGKWSADEALPWITDQRSVFPWNLRDPEGNLSFLQLGIRTADRVTTVSPTYASEVLTESFGEGLAPDLRIAGIQGILNGIDIESYDPATDLALPTRYSAADFVSGKQSCKQSLQAELGLPDTPNAPLFVNVGRLVPQKGIDLLVPLISKIVNAGGQVALLGSGFPDIETSLRAAERLGPVRVKIGFDSALGRRMYAGADFFLMPSRFEPCGLGQLIAMRYGAIPIVRDTGGLHDTVPDYGSDPARGLGLTFSEPTIDAAWGAIERALHLFSQPSERLGVAHRSMTADHSWYNSATAYAALYEQTKKGAAAQ